MSIYQSHRHHYVPEWYQRRFLAEGQSAFQILDLKPIEYRDVKGRLRGHSSSILQKGPAAWFYEKDFYSTRVLGESNDDIERYLFGSIDREGSIAIDAFLDEDWNKVHKTYWFMYEFMDALRLRTPKGLRYLKTISGAQDHSDLLMLMQKLRRMHCVMWAEGFREIVSAKDCDAKFIFTDHPVTFFNRHVFPADPRIPRNCDPPQQWQATQTLFPFDRDRLFILTHKEWARAPLPNNARIPRTNPRYFDNNTMVWYHDTIRNRKLTNAQVYEVNFILKKKAFRYIAGRSIDDLFPEAHLKTIMWNKLGTFLLPSGFELGKQLGYTVIEKADGTFCFQDEFGRNPKSKSEYDVEVIKAREVKAQLEQILAKKRGENF